MVDYILSIDLGTTGNRVIVFDKNATIISKEYSEFSQIYPHPGWVEHDAIEILNCVNKLLTKTFENISPSDVKGIGITNQRETIVCFNKKTRKPYCNAIVWQDSRTSNFCMELKNNKTFENYVHENTGLKLDPYFSGTKIKWIIDNVILTNTNNANDFENGDVLFGTIDTWIVYNLTGEFVTDHTNASRTLIYNLNTGAWDEKLANVFGVKLSHLPKIVSSSEIVGYYAFNNNNNNNDDGAVSIPVCGIAGDQQSALFGQRCFEKGYVKNTYGTGCFCLMNTGTNKIISKNGLLTTVGISILDKNKNTVIEYALEGSVFIGGAVIQWLRDEMKFIKSASETEDICNSIDDTQGVYFVPAFSGLGTPYWKPDVRGTIFGLTRGSNKKHIVRAAVESIAFQSYDLIKTMEAESKIPLQSIKTDGGATNNNFLMQFQSDILNKKVLVSEVEETTALGAAFLAGLAVSFWKDIDELKSLNVGVREFSPKMDEITRNELTSQWNKHVNSLL